VLDALLALPGAVRSLGPGFPQVRAGVAAGAALERAGDWYGAVVNLASRITGAAPPDGVIVTEAVRRAAPAGYEWRDAGSPPLKGVEETPALFLVTGFSQSRS
jgi:adenylate cyclase